jgi:anti-sigma B factor antagonist
MVNGVPVVAAPAEIDASNADWLRAVLLEAACRGHGTFVVDMSHTRLCTSAGLGVLVRAHDRALAEGGELRLVIPASCMVLRIFALTGIDQVIPNFADLDEALQPAPAAASPPHPRTPAAARPRRHNQPGLTAAPGQVPGSCRGRYHTDRRARHVSPRARDTPPAARWRSRTTSGSP